MATPRFNPTPPLERARAYASPDVVPTAWMPTRPADLDGLQPAGPMLGHPAPDAGYALRLAELVRSDVIPGEGLTTDDALAGATAIALRRASVFGRAPVMPDLRLALGIWGFLDDNPPAELVTLRTRLFVGIGHSSHHYAEIRTIVDMIPETTLSDRPVDTMGLYPSSWRTLVGA